MIEYAFNILTLLSNDKGFSFASIKTKAVFQHILQTITREQVEQTKKTSQSSQIITVCSTYESVETCIVLPQVKPWGNRHSGKCRTFILTENQHAWSEAASGRGGFNVVREFSWRHMRRSSEVKPEWMGLPVPALSRVQQQVMWRTSSLVWAGTGGRSSGDPFRRQTQQTISTATRTTWVVFTSGNNL